MKRLRIVTDSVCDLPAELAARYEITVVPVLVKLGDAVYRDGELTLEQLYDPGNPPPYTEAPSREELPPRIPDACGAGRRDPLDPCGRQSK